MAMMDIPTILHTAVVMAEAREISYADVKYLCLVLWGFSNTSWIYGFVNQIGFVVVDLDSQNNGFC